MNFKMKLAVAGVAGRMGQMLVKTIDASSGGTVSGATERAGHEWNGQDLGLCMGGPAVGVIVRDDPAEAFKDADVLIDFTSPESTVRNAAAAADLGCAVVIGTTGLSDDDLSAIGAAARKTAIVRAGNMSLGINLMVLLTQSVARALDDDFDIEIVEAHHRHKVDAPSGTALMLGEAAATGRGISLKTASDRGRDGITGSRTRGNIGFSAIRGGNIIGEHDVVFAGEGERVVLRHIATDRAIYAQGALKAAQWVLGRPPGEYGMKDVLGL